MTDNLATYEVDDIEAEAQLVTITATTDGVTTELVCPTCHSPVAADPDRGLWHTICTGRRQHVWPLDTLINHQPQQDA